MKTYGLVLSLGIFHSIIHRITLLTVSLPHQEDETLGTKLFHSLLSIIHGVKFRMKLNVRTIKSRRNRIIL